MQWFFSRCAHNAMKCCAGSHAELIMHLCRRWDKSGMHCHKWASRHQPDGGRLSAIWRLVTLPIDGASGWEGDGQSVNLGNLDTPPTGQSVQMGNLCNREFSELILDVNLCYYWENSLRKEENCTIGEITNSISPKIVFLVLASEISI